MTLTYLGRVFILRDLRRHPARAALSVAGVAIGVAVVFAVQAASTSAVSSFASNVAAISRASEIRISANGLPLAEDIISQIPWIWNYGTMTPSVLGRVALADSQQPRTNPLYVLGADLFASSTLGSNLLVEGQTDLDIEKFLEWVTRDDSVFVPAQLAARLNLRADSAIRVTAASGSRTLRVAGVLRDSGVGSAFGGNVLIMDIASAQVLLGKVGSLDSVDVFLRNSGDRETVVNRLRSDLTNQAIVDTPDRENQQNERMLRAFRLNIGALSATSLIVGVVAVYAALSAAVVRRRTEIAILRSLGTPRSTVVCLFCFQALLLGTIGSLIGVILGSALAQVSSELVTRTVADLYTGLSSLQPLSVWPNPKDVLWAIALGVALSTASGIFPAWRAGLVSPTEGLQGAHRPVDERVSRRRAWVGIALLTMGVLSALGPPIRGLPMLGYLAAALGIIGTGLLMPSLIRILLRSVGLVSASSNAQLALRNVIHARYRCSAAATGFAVSVAMIVSVGTMVSSFRQTVTVWIGETLRADIYIRPATLDPGDWNSFVSEDDIAAIRNAEGIDQLDLFRGLKLVYNGSPVVLGSSDFGALGEHRRLLFTDGTNSAQATKRIASQDRVLISEPFSLRQNVRKGEVISLPTPSGPGRFHVENVFFDYSNDRGVILLDRSTYQRWYNDPRISSIAVYLKPGASSETARQDIARRLSESRLIVIGNRELREQVLRIFDQTFRITYALEGIAVFCALLGISNAMASFVLERRAEIAMLRFAGAEPRWIKRLIVSESGALGGASILVGAVLGAMLSALLIWVINRQSFGWTIQLSVPEGFLTVSLLVLMVASLASGVYPARLALKQDPLVSIRTD